VTDRGPGRRSTRLAHVGRLRPEGRERYLALHADPWPEVVQGLRERHVANYSIFRRDDLLFSYMEYGGDDFTADMSRPFPRQDEWMAAVTPLLQPFDQRSPGEWWSEMEDVFHLD
jgi:L-rhamnose mutarotase